MVCYPKASSAEGITLDLTDDPWDLLQAIIPAPPRRLDGRGRPWRGGRAVLNGLLWILRTGAQCQDLPERYPPSHTCHRRFQHWVRSGVLERVLQALAAALRGRGGLDLAACCIDGTFMVAKKGAASGKAQAGQRYEGHGHGRPRWSSCRRPR
jgi:transposase